MADLACRSYVLCDLEAALSKKEGTGPWPYRIFERNLHRSRVSPSEAHIPAKESSHLEVSSGEVSGEVYSILAKPSSFSVTMT